MKTLNRSFTAAQPLPIKVIQFGDGNFLKGFADYIIDKLNEQGFNCGVAVVKNRPGGSIAHLQKQEGLFTLFTEGIKDGQAIREKRLITCINKVVNPYDDYTAFLDLAKEELKIIISNTTEAGIYFDEHDTALNAGPHQSFAAKLTALLHARYLHISGTAGSLIILPCELIEDNGILLKLTVLQYCNFWQLDNDFVNWLNINVTFYNTLVDRIVSGFPKDNIAEYTRGLEYDDALITVSEPYLLWAIEGDETLRDHFPYHLVYNVLNVDNLHLYRIRKVRILNGAHTLLAQIGPLAGVITVGQGMDNDFCTRFIKDAIYNEILPVIPLPLSACEIYTVQVLDRFSNPYLNHYLKDIAVNSVSKFRVRLLPVVKDYYGKYGTLPVHIIFSLAALIWHYKTPGQADQADVLKIFSKAWSLEEYANVVSGILVTYFNDDGLPLDEMQNLLARALQYIELYGVEEGFKKIKLV